MTKPTMGEIIQLNVGGTRFSTSRQTLTWNPDTFFTSLLSGRISTQQDDSGAIFIDRDPKLFSVILNFLRTKELQLRNVDISALRHEAEFYGIRALVRRLALCEDLDHSSCGDVLFHAYFQTPNQPLRDSSSSCQSIVSVEGGESQSQRRNTRQGVNETCGAGPPRQDAGPTSSERRPGHSRHDSFDSRQQGVQHMSHLAPGGLDIIRASSSHRIEHGSYKCNDDNLRVTMVRGHQNWICAAFPHFVCCFRMKESTGWHLLWTSQHMDAEVERVALNAKVMGSNQENLNNKMVAASSGSLVWLWAVNDEGESRQIGVFNLHVLVDNLIFIGSQLVALSCTGKVGVWHSMTQHWQIQDVVPITSYDTAGSFLLLGCKDGSIYYIDMQKFPLRMKDNDLLVTELYTDPSHDMVTALSVYLTPKTSLSGNWIEIAYGTSCGTVRVIVQHPETVGHGPQLFQTFTVHRSPVTKVMLSEKHLVSVCSEYNHVRTWNVTRFRGMISTQPGSMPLASFKILSLDDVEPNISYCAGNDFGPFGEQDDQQLFFQKVVADTDQLFVRLSSTGQRVCVIRSVDSSNISAFCVHECEGSSRMGSCLRRYLFTGHTNGSMQMWDLTTALDIFNKQEEKGKEIGQGGPTSEELVRLLEHVDLSSSRCCTPGESLNASMLNLATSSSQRNLSWSAAGASGGSSSSDDVSGVLDTTIKSKEENDEGRTRPASGVKVNGASSSQGDKVWL